MAKKEVQYRVEGRTERLEEAEGLSFYKTGRNLISGVQLPWTRSKEASKSLPSALY